MKIVPHRSPVHHTMWTWFYFHLKRGRADEDIPQTFTTVQTNNNSDKFKLPRMYTPATAHPLSPPSSHHLLAKDLEIHVKSLISKSQNMAVLSVRPAD